MNNLNRTDKPVITTVKCGSNHFGRGLHFAAYWYHENNNGQNGFTKLQVK